MSVDMGAYEQTVSKVRGGVGTIEGAIPTLQHGAASLANISPFLIPPPIVNWVIAAINKFLDWVIDVLKFVLDLIEGILAPFFFYGWAGNWRGFLKQGATDAQAIMNGLPIAKSGDPLWKGPGADAYKAKVPAQVAAAQALADVCDSAGSVCMDLATAGVLLYFAVASLILTLTGGLAAVAAEICSVLGIPAAPPTAIASRRGRRRGDRLDRGGRDWIRMVVGSAVARHHRHDGVRGRLGEGAGSLRWWSGLVVLVIAIGPACYAYVTLEGSLAHVAGLLTIVAVALAGMTVVRRYEMPPVGR